MIAESIAIQQAFQGSGLLYATLKGFSLSPESVPKAELRHQFDLDFLVAEESAREARQILERRGYRLYAISGRSWEFKINEKPVLALQDMYKDSPGRAVELHIEPQVAGRPSLLGRIERREFHGICMPVLSPVDLFLGQGLHVYKHVFSEFSRAAHLLEFRRHVLLRRDDETSLGRASIRRRGESPFRAGAWSGYALDRARDGRDFAPKALTGWTVDRLPPFAQLWINLYGRRVVLDNFPGSKALPVVAERA